jgi:hypothetical protein
VSFTERIYNRRRRVETTRRDIAKSGCDQSSSESNRRGLVRKAQALERGASSNGLRQTVFVSVTAGRLITEYAMNPHAIATTPPMANAFHHFIHS